MTKDEKISKLKNKIDKCKQNIESNYKNKLWGYYQQLYQAMVTPVEGTATWRAHECIPLVYQTIQDTLPRITRGLLGESGQEFFSIYPRMKSDYILKAKSAKSFEAVIKYHLDASDFGIHFHNAVLNSLVYGIGWLKLWWLYDKKSFEYFDIKTGKVEKAKQQVITDRPAFSSPNPNKVFWDDEATSYKTMKIAGETEEKTYDEVEACLDIPGYNNAEIKRFMADKEKKYDEDPTIRYCYDTAWTEKEVLGLLDGTYLIREHINPIKSGVIRIPYFPIVYSPEPGSIVGRGIAQILSGYQETASDIQNLTLDALYITVNPIFIKKTDSTIKNENLELQPGAVVELDEVGDLIRLDMGSINPQMFQELETIMSLANRLTGSAAGIMFPGQVGGEVNNGTATGATILQEEANIRFAYTITYNKINAIKPMVKLLIDLEQQNLDIDNIEELVGSKRMEDIGIEKDNLDMSVDYDFIITGTEGMRGQTEDLNNLTKAITIMAQIPGGIESLNVEAVLDRIAKDTGLPKEFIKAVKPMGDVPVKIDINQMKPESQKQLNMLASKLNTTPQALVERLNGGEKIEDIINEAKGSV